MRISSLGHSPITKPIHIQIDKPKFSPSFQENVRKNFGFKEPKLPVPSLKQNVDTRNQIKIGKLERMFSSGDNRSSNSD